MTTLATRCIIPEFRKSIVKGVIEIHDAGEIVGFLQRMRADRTLWGLYWHGEDMPFAILELRRAKDYFVELYNARKPTLWKRVELLAQPDTIPGLDISNGVEDSTATG